MKKLKGGWRMIKKIFFYIFSDTKNIHPDMSYYYDIEDEYSGDITSYRKHDTKYPNDTFNGGEGKKEADWKLHKSSDIFPPEK